MVKLLSFQVISERRDGDHHTALLHDMIRSHHTVACDVEESRVPTSNRPDGLEQYLAQMLEQYYADLKLPGLEYPTCPKRKTFLKRSDGRIDMFTDFGDKGICLLCSSQQH